MSSGRSLDQGCADCGAVNVVMLEMQPGRDRKSWWLCCRCWLATARRELPVVRRRA